MCMCTHRGQSASAGRPPHYGPPTHTAASHTRTPPDTARETGGLRSAKTPTKKKESDSFHRLHSYDCTEFYLSFEHFQHSSQLLQPLLQPLQLVTFRFRRLSPLRRCGGAERRSSLQLVALDVLGKTPGFLLCPAAALRLTAGHRSLEHS